ncbi:hypothetical protein C8J34_11612 [Rhizobium sp. PP-F2F-G36]|nr:hypothetical protein C8J34_11612 [Rhizobium sp. PP-F2F-G36]
MSGMFRWLGAKPLDADADHIWLVDLFESGFEHGTVDREQTGDGFDRLRGRNAVAVNAGHEQVSGQGVRKPGKLG